MALNVDGVAPCGDLYIDVRVDVVPDVHVVGRTDCEVLPDEVQKRAAQSFGGPPLHRHVDRHVGVRRCHPTHHRTQIIRSHVEITGYHPTGVVQRSDVLPSPAERDLISDLGRHQIFDQPIVADAQLVRRAPENVTQFILLHRVCGCQIRLDTHPQGHGLEYTAVAGQRAQHHTSCCGQFRGVGGTVANDESVPHIDSQQFGIHLCQQFGNPCSTTTSIRTVQGRVPPLERLRRGRGTGARGREVRCVDRCAVADSGVDVLLQWPTRPLLVIALGQQRAQLPPPESPHFLGDPSPCVGRSADRLARSPTTADPLADGYRDTAPQRVHLCLRGDLQG